jgi:signal transduction histidine kinase
MRRRSDIPRKIILSRLTSDSRFPNLVSLACHDLRTPLATVHGFARTLERIEPLSERTVSYIKMIEAASAEMVVLLDELSLVARIEGQRYEPNLVAADSLDLVRAAAETVDAGEVTVAGRGSDVAVDREPASRAIAAFATCALRHGGLARVSYAVDGAELRLTPVAEDVAPILLGENMRDLGAATASRLVRATGGSVAVEGDALAVRLATSAAGTSGDP